MSTSTVDCLDVYKEAVDKTCASVDANIKVCWKIMSGIHFGRIRAVSGAPLGSRGLEKAL